MSICFTDDYYRSVYNVNKYLGVKTNFAVINEPVITGAVTEKWAKRTFNRAIWGHRETLSKDIESTLTKGLIKGSGIDKVSAELSKRCDVGFSNAKRLVRTETSRIHNQATLDAYENEAGIEKYKFLAALDFIVSRMPGT